MRVRCKKDEWKLRSVLSLIPMLDNKLPKVNEEYEVVGYVVKNDLIHYILKEFGVYRSFSSLYFDVIYDEKTERDIELMNVVKNIKTKAVNPVLN